MYLTRLYPFQVRALCSPIPAVFSLMLLNSRKGIQGQSTLLADIFTWIPYAAASVSLDSSLKENGLKMRVEWAAAMHTTSKSWFKKQGRNLFTLFFSVLPSTGKSLQHIWYWFSYLVDAKNPKGQICSAYLASSSKTTSWILVECIYLDSWQHIDVKTTIICVEVFFSLFCPLESAKCFVPTQCYFQKVK